MTYNPNVRLSENTDLTDQLFSKVPQTTPEPNLLSPNNTTLPFGFSTQSSATIQMNLDALTSLISQLLKAQAATHEDVAEEMEDDWSLTSTQMLFMMQHNNVLETALNDDDLETVRELADSKIFQEVFEGMGFDEAYDRYLTMLEEGRA